MHVIKTSQPIPTDPPYVHHWSCLSSVSSSPLSSSQSESSSPFEVDFGDCRLLNLDSDVDDMACDIPFGIGVQDTVGTDFQPIDFDTLLSYAYPVTYSDTTSDLEPDDTIMKSSCKRLNRHKPPFLPMMMPGSDPGAFLFPGEHEQIRHSDDFLLSRTIAPALLSSSSASTTETGITLTNTDDATTTTQSATSTSFMSPAGTATSDTASTIFSTEPYLFEEDDVVEIDRTITVQPQLEDRERTGTTRGNVVQPSLQDQIRCPVKSSNFAIVIPTSRSETSKPMNSMQVQKRRPSTIRLRSTPTASATANTNSIAPRRSTRRSRSIDESTSSRRYAAQKRKLSEAGLDERPDLGPRPIVNNTVTLKAPISTPTGSQFAIVIKKSQVNDTKAVKIQTGDPSYQFHQWQDSNKRQKTFARIAVAVGALTAGLALAKIFV
ncbi:hypothetical protein V1509DRAFT_617095 [Lipomyces kononenkoae]